MNHTALFPAFTSPDHFDEIRGNLEDWRPAILTICKRHSLPMGELRTFANGTNIVFSTGAGQIVKLFPPFLRNQYESDALVTSHVYGKTPLETPEIQQVGSLEDWPYL